MNENEKLILFNVLEKARERHSLGKNMIFLSIGKNIYALEIKNIRQARDAFCLMTKLERKSKKNNQMEGVRKVSDAEWMLRAIIGSLFILLKYHDFHFYRVFNYKKAERWLTPGREKGTIFNFLLGFNKGPSGSFGKYGRGPEEDIILKNQDFYEELRAGYKNNKYILEYIQWSKSKDESKMIEAEIIKNEATTKPMSKL